MDLSQRSDLTRSVHHSSGSYELVVGAVIFSLIGLLVDRSLGTTPWLTLGFAFAGFVGAAVSLYYRFQRDLAAAQELRRNAERNLADAATRTRQHEARS